MKKSNSIVRTKTIYGNNRNPDEMYYEIDFMTFSRYMLKKNPDYIIPDYKFELYPYKWYDISWIYQIPSYWLLLRIFRNSEAKINKQIHNKASIITLIIEILLATKPIIELTKIFITK